MSFYFAETHMPTWVIPILENGEQVGEVRLGETIEIMGEEYLDFREVDDVQIYEVSALARTDPPAEIQEVFVPEIAPPQPLPGILEFFLGIDLEEARAKGREVYEQALELAEAEGIPLPEALRKAGERENAA